MVVQRDKKKTGGAGDGAESRDAKNKKMVVMVVQRDKKKEQSTTMPTVSLVGTKVPLRV